MSCQACVQIPLDAHARFIQKTRVPKTLDTSEFRIVITPETSRNLSLTIDGIRLSGIVQQDTYRRFPSGTHAVELWDRDTGMVVEEDFDFEPDTFYTLVVHQDTLFHIQDDLICPEPGMSRLQVFRLENHESSGAVNVFLEDALLFEQVIPDEFAETEVPSGIYDFTTEPELTPPIEVDLTSGTIYTVFLLDPPLVLENTHCME